MKQTAATSEGCLSHRGVSLRRVSTHAQACKQTQSMPPHADVVTVSDHCVPSANSVRCDFQSCFSSFSLSGGLTDISYVFEHSTILVKTLQPNMWDQQIVVKGKTIIMQQFFARLFFFTRRYLLIDHFIFKLCLPWLLLLIQTSCT